MKRLTSLVTASLVLAIGLSTARAVNTRYFDINDDAIGSGVQDGQGYTWDTVTTTGTGGWNANSDGSGAAPGTTVAWVNGDDAVFSAGTDGIGLTYGLSTIVAGTTAHNVTIEDGTVLINTSAGSASYSMSGTTEVLAGAKLATNQSGQFAGTGILKLSGGELAGRNVGTAGTTINNLINWEINGTGTVSYDDGDAVPDDKVSIINGSIITGTGGTPTNGGAGTLIKTGPDQIGYAARDIGGVGNFTFNSFAKFRVTQGTFRLRQATVGGVANTVDDRMFGATPLASLPDAITLDGGGIGTNTTLTLSNFRGITVTANGGFFDNGATGGFNVPGPLTAAQGSVLTIGSPTSTSASAPAIEFSNAGNSTTFQGDIFMIKSLLRVKSDMTARHFSGTGNSATVFGILEIGGGNTFTGGTDNLDASFDGRVRDYTGTGGAGTGGTFKWDGTGTLTMNTGTGAEWSNTGGVNINKGSIKFGNSASGFGTTTPITIGATAKLNMNGINDTFGSLTGPAGAVVDMNDSGSAAVPGNLTLGATTGTTTYSGTITGGGNLTKAGTASTANQILAGNTSLGIVTVSAGTLTNNATMTTTGGVTVASGATLGGTGTISGAVGNTGIIAPGSGGVGTLHVTGNVTDNAASSWAIDLSGATADKLAVIGSIDLNAADTLNVTGAGTGSSWIIGTYTGSLAGVFDTITAGYTVTYTGGNITLNAAAVGLPGDFNSDGKVDAGDYATWRKNEIPNAALANDGGVGNQAARFSLWRANFGNPPGAGSGGGLSGASVPEPTSIVLLVSSLGFVFAGRRRTR